MRRAFSAACLMLCLSGSIAAMPEQLGTSSSPKTFDPAAPPPPPVIVAAFLGFSPAQGDQFHTLLDAFFGTLKNLEEQKKAREQALQQLVNSPNRNPAAIGVIVLQIHAIEQQGAQAAEAFHKAFLNLLTGDQLQKVQAVVQAAQLAPVVGAFQALYLVPAASEPPGR